MRTATSSGLGLGIGLLLLAGCDLPTAPYRAVALRTATDTIIESASGPVHPVQLYLLNTGNRTVNVRLCNLPAPNIPAAVLRLEQQQPDGSWRVVPNYVSCFDPANGFDQAIAPGNETQVARLLPAFQSGRYRYQVSYSASDGTRATVTSPPIVVIYQ
jgi:hypothetical protein